MHIPMKMLTMLACLCAFFTSPNARAQSAGTAATTQTAAIEPLMDMSKITDPKVKAIIEEIAGKVAAIREVYIEEYLSDDPMNPAASDHPAKMIVRRDGSTFLYNSGMNKTMNQVQIKEIWIFDNRKVTWQVFKGYSEVAKKDVTLAAKVDLEKLRAAGIKNEMTSRSPGQIFSSFHGIDPATLKLVRETPEEWVLKANVLPEKYALVHGAKAETITINRKTGFGSRSMLEGEVPRTEVMNKVHINPNPPIPEAYFEYTPPADAFVMDATDQAIQEALAAQNPPKQ